MSDVLNLFVIAAVGVIIADLVANKDGTTALFNGLGGLWSTAVSGMLGNAPSGAPPAKKK